MQRRITVLFTLVATMTMYVSMVGQIGLQQASDSILDLSHSFSGLPIACTDLNGDQLDDIAYLEDGTDLNIALQKPDGTFLRKQIKKIDGEYVWSIVAADFTGNGRSEIVVGTVSGAILVQFDVAMNLASSHKLQGTSFFVQTMSAGDFNRDGWVDLFLCNDHGTSVILRNVMGDLIPLSSPWIDFNTDPPSDNSGNYGSVYTDFDRDGDMDLYIAKCKPNVMDPEDPRRVNELYERNGDSTFVERAEEYGLDLGAQSWTGDFGDVDGDGDMDALVTHHDVPSQLLINEGGQFVDNTQDAGLIETEFPLQGLFVDLDNDGASDIVLAGHEHGLFRNLGNGTFERTSIGSPYEISSFAFGDLNTDGRLDLFTSQTGFIADPTDVPDDIWLNTGPKNHWIRLHLEDESGNRDAVGASAILYGSFGSIYREVRVGESYGITNSTTLHFGVGAEGRTDSLSVRWPDGQEKTWYEIDDNTHYYLKRGHCLSTSVPLVQGNKLRLCPGDSLILEAPDVAHSDWEWSTGAESKEIVVREHGLYHLSFTDSEGCRRIAGPVSIENPLNIQPTIDYEESYRRCASDSVSLSTGQWGNVRWSDGSTEQTLMPSSGGTYYFDVMTPCGSVRSDSISLSLFPADPPSVNGDTLEQPGDAMVSAQGGEVSWFDSPDAQDPVHQGDTLNVNDVSGDTTFYAESQYLNPGQQYALGEPDPGDNTYPDVDAKHGLLFEVHQPITIDSVTVFTDTSGPRVILVRERAGAEKYRDTFHIDKGMNQLALGLDITQSGAYEMTVDGSFNTQVFGSRNPRLYRSQGMTDYPYRLEPFVSIYNSTAGENYYYYFYDWNIRSPDVRCTSNRVPVSVEVLSDTTSMSFPLEQDAWSLQPNPSGEWIRINRDKPSSPGQLKIEIIDIHGKIHHRTEQFIESDLRISVRDLTPGIYFIRIASRKGILYAEKLIVR